MGAELQARTEPGRRLVLLAEELAADFATRAAAHDRDGSYPHEDVAALRDAGYLAAPIPQALGGMGVESVHDLIVAASRLARGDASVAIGASMHLIPLDQHRPPLAGGDARRRRAARGGLREHAGAGRRRGRGDGGGRRASRTRTSPARAPARSAPTTAGSSRGHKVFCTMSPAATELYAAVTLRRRRRGAVRLRAASRPRRPASG